MPRVVEINCVEHLQAYRLAWSSLWRRTKGAGFKQTLDWFTAYCRTVDSVIRPRALITLGDDDEVLGILPLVVREETTRVGTLRVLGFPLILGLGGCGPVGNLATLTLWEGLRHVADTPRDWDVLDLQGINIAGLDSRRTIGALSSSELDAELDTWREPAVVELKNNWEAYRSTRDPLQRATIEEAEGQLDQTAETTYVRYRPAGAMHGDDDPRWDWYADCLTVARRSKQATTPGDITLSTPARAELFRAAHEAAAQVGALDLNLLYVNGTAAAFIYNYAVDGALTTIAAGYDPRFEADEVESVLRWAMLRESHELGDRTLDLGRASRWETAFWRTGSARLLRAVHYRPGKLRAQTLRFGRMWRKRLTHPFREAASF